jgi:hypothetical protein
MALPDQDIRLFGEDNIRSWIAHMPNEFKTWLDQEYARQVQELAIATDMFMVARCQGRMEMIKLLEQLRKES